MLAATDIIFHIIFHLPPLHVPLQPLKRTIPHPSLSRTGGDNVADRRLYEAINSFCLQVDTDWKAGYSVLVKEPFCTCQRAFCLKGKTKEGLGTEAVLQYCWGGFLLGQDFFKSRFQVVFFGRSGLCKCDTPPLNASTWIVLGFRLCVTNGPMRSRSEPKIMFPSIALLGSVKKGFVMQTKIQPLAV